jgi:hypothetical protein
VTPILDGTPDSELRDGDSVAVYTSEPSMDLDDATVRVVWRPDGTAESQTLAIWDGGMIR